MFFAPCSFDALPAEQAAGICAFHVLVAEDGSVLGRLDPVGIEDHTAELGYRVAQCAAGRGVATATVRDLCRPAAAQYRPRTLRAATTLRNVELYSTVPQAVSATRTKGRPYPWNGEQPFG